MWVGQHIKICDNSYNRRVGIDDSRLVWIASSKSWKDLYGQEVTVVSEPITKLIEDIGITCYSVKMIKVLTSDLDAYWVLFEGSKGYQLYYLPENPFKFFLLLKQTIKNNIFPL